MTVSLASLDAMPVSDRERRSDPGGARERWLSWLPVIYALVLILTRLLSSQSLEHDEAEQLLFTQRPAWGYSLQPPLYTWLTWAALQTFGVNLVALSVVKAGLLAALFAILAALLRRLGVPRHGAAAAALTLLCCPFFAWNVTLNLTHTVLSTVFFAATLWHVLVLIERPSAPRYVLLGTLMALGVLAKYNFVVFAGALLLAGLTLPAPRRVILDRRMVLAFAVSAALLAPHLAWLRANWGGVVAALQDKTGLGEDTGLSRLTSGFGQLLRQTVLLLLPIAAAYFLCLGRDCRALFAARIGQAPCSGTSSMPLALLERTGLMLGALMVILVIAGVSRMTAGWLAPGLVLVPPIVFGRLAARGWPEGLAARLGTLAVAVMLIAATVRIACYGAWHGRNLGRDLLFVQAVADIRERGRAERPLIADNLLTAGNLRFYAPELKVTALGMPLFDVGVRNGDAPILVWNASEKMPPYLETYLRRTGADLAHAELVELERNDLHARFRRLAFLELSPESR